MKVSVIIPIYNVEKYIDRGLTNFLKQTYQNFEILLVDDGSTDGSPALCEAWAARYDRIHVFHKENGGSGSARNFGIEKANGEYIYFFDIDDLADDTLLEYCVRTMDESDADMMVFSYRNKDVTTGQEYEIVMDDICIKSNDELRNAYVDQFVMKMNGFPWNKMYRRSFLNEHHLRFEDLLIQQDEVFNLSIYPHVTKMVISSKVLYTYYIYNKGNTRSRFIPNRFDIYLTVNSQFRSLIEYWQLDDNRLNDYLYKRFYNGVLQCMLFNITHLKCSWTKHEKYKQMQYIMNIPLTIQSFKWADKNEQSIEHILYRYSCRNQSLISIQFFTCVFNFLHKINLLLK